MPLKLVLTFIILLISNFVSGDVIELKSGEQYEGKIILENSVFIRLDTINAEDGRIKEFLRNNIKNIKKGAMLAPQAHTVEGNGLKNAEPESIAMETVIEHPEGREDEEQLINQKAANEKKILEQKRLAEARLTAVVQEMRNENKLEEKVIAEGDAEPEKLDNASLNKLLGNNAAAQNDTYNMSGSMSPEEMEQMQAQMQEQMQQMLNSPEVKKMKFMAFGIFGVMISVFFGIAAFIAFLISKKLDQDIEVLSKRGGAIRRLTARFIDFILGILIIISLMLIPGVFIPLDSSGGTVVMIIMFLSMFVFFWYFYVGISKLKNTYGRYATGVRVVDVGSQAKPSLGQAFKREFLLAILWPIEIFIMAFTKTKRRIGDRWAGTEVLVVETKKPLIMRVIPGLLIGGIGFIILNFVTPMVCGRTLIGQEAKAFVERKYGSEMAASLKNVQILNNEGWVTFKLKDGNNVGINLQRRSGKWAITKFQPIMDSQLGKGLSIKYQN